MSGAEVGFEGVLVPQMSIVELTRAVLDTIVEVVIHALSSTPLIVEMVNLVNPAPNARVMANAVSQRMQSIVVVILVVADINAEVVTLV